MMTKEEEQEIRDAADLQDMTRFWEETFQNSLAFLIQKQNGTGDARKNRSDLVDLASDFARLAVIYRGDFIKANTVLK